MKSDRAGNSSLIIWKLKSYHPNKLIIGRPKDRAITGSSIKEQSEVARISKVEPKTIEEALADKSWIPAMEE